MCRNGSDADFSTQACFYVTMKYVDAGLEAVQQVFYKKIIMMSQIQFCSQKFIGPTKAKRQDHPF